MKKGGDVYVVKSEKWEIPISSITMFVNGHRKSCNKSVVFQKSL